MTFIWSPRVLDLSLGLLSHSPSTLFFPSPFFLSSSTFPPFCYRLPTARSLEQSGTSYSGFQTRRQGSHPLSPTSSSCTSFFGRRRFFWSHHLLPLIGGGLISRTTSVKIDNRTSTRAGYASHGHQNANDFLLGVNRPVLSRLLGNSKTNSIQWGFLILTVSRWSTADNPTDLCTKLCNFVETPNICHYIDCTEVSRENRR